MKFNPESAPLLPGWVRFYSGKVRDLYAPDEEYFGGPHPFGDVVLVVASDRISAFDHVLEPGIPGKGVVLTQLSLWWFAQLKDIVNNHVISAEVTQSPKDGLVPTTVAGRGMICRRLTMFPVECVARGYLTGSGLLEYEADGTVCGLSLPPGLVDGSRLSEPIFTPATKAELGEHDENVTFERVQNLIGEANATQLRELTIGVYDKAEQLARERDVILADTKFEFGVNPITDETVLGDEVLTPDSSRFWDMKLWQPGGSQASFDKQYVRDWLKSPESGWDAKSDQAPPALPPQVVAATQARYLEAYERLTGEHLDLSRYLAK